MDRELNPTSGIRLHFFRDRRLLSKLARLGNRVCDSWRPISALFSSVPAVGAELLLGQADCFNEVGEALVLERGEA